MGYIIFDNDGSHWFWNGEEITEAEFDDRAAKAKEAELKAQAYDIVTGVNE